MNHRKFFCIFVAVALLGHVEAYAEQPVTRAQFDSWLAEISNWGRWGEADELGTLNLITPEKRIAAAALVRDGISVSLALDLNKTKDEVNTNPFEHVLTVVEFGGHEAASDKYSVDYHGFAHSHMDGLTHFANNGKMYNGFPVEGLKPTGAEKLGIENVFAGVFTRGVLVDMPWFKGVDYLEPGTALGGRRPGHRNHRNAAVSSASITASAVP